MQFHRVIRIALAAAALAAATGARSQILECIDASGKREFAQKCAPGTVRQREVSKSGTGSLDSSAPPSTSYKQDEAAFRQRQLERESLEAKESTDAANAGRRCDYARSRLLSLENARRVQSGSDPKTGERRYMDAAERAAAVQKARDAVAASCK